jgi:hypothetical protein
VAASGFETPWQQTSGNMKRWPRGEICNTSWEKRKSNGEKGFLKVESKVSLSVSQIWVHTYSSVGYLVVSIFSG